MTALVITPYAPYRDGIANYSVQEVAALRRSGEDVEVLSPLPSAAHHHLVIGWPVGMVRLLRRVGAFDRVVVQFYPELLFGSCRNCIDRLVVWILLGVLVRRIPTELRVHELDYRAATCDAVTVRAARWALAGADVTVHTEAERQQLISHFGPAMERVRLVDHGRAFERRTSAQRSEARSSLDIPEGAFVFLAIGFVQRHKGFDRAVRALGRVDAPEARLYVVGGVRRDHPDFLTYEDELRHLVESTDRTEARLGYVSDEEFDRWIVAADRIVLPYREIWSSGVIERAGLYDVPVITTAVGGLADQAPPGSVIVTDDRELAAAMAAACSGRLMSVADADIALADRESIESTIRRRAGSPTRDTATSSPAGAFVGLAPATTAPAESTRPMVAFVKRVVQRLVHWQTAPIVAHVNELAERSVASARITEARLADLEQRQGRDSADDHPEAGTGS